MNKCRLCGKEHKDETYGTQWRTCYIKKSGLELGRYAIAKGFGFYEPRLTMDELWRIAKTKAQLAISMPYGYSDGYLQDPTHCNACNHATWQYFDPRFPLYSVYNPKPWEIERGFPQWQQNGNMEVMLRKIDETTNEA